MSFTLQRIVIKVGTNLLTHSGKQLNRERMADIVRQIAVLREQGIQIVLVSSGAVAAGASSGVPTPSGKGIPARQIFAAVGQPLLMRTYAELCAPYDIPVAQALFTRTELKRDGYLNARNTLLGLLEAGVLPICNENDVVATAELQQIGDNDTLSALAANLVDADLLAILTDIKGLYTADPRNNTAATHVPVVESITREVEAMAGGAGTASSIGGMATKVKAARMATAAGTDVVICQGTIPNVMMAIVAGEQVGTRFASKVSRTKSLRDAWMASDLARGHRIIVDAGAANALLRSGRSLLPAGIVAIEGAFDRGDTVEIRAAGGDAFACGLANYPSDELRKVMGKKSSEIAKLLPESFGDEAVHRNNMVFL
jgi:glutamate 5-kinase